MIRAATVEDIRPIVDMVRAYYVEGVNKFGFPLHWSEQKVVIYIGNLLWRQDTGLNFIASGGQGVILGEVGETWFGDNKIARPAFLYVKPEERNGLIARALLRRFEKRAAALGALMVVWDFDTGVTDGRLLGGLMKALKYEITGPICRKVFEVNYATNSSVHPAHHSGGRAVAQ